MSKSRRSERERSGPSGASSEYGADKSPEDTRAELEAVDVGPDASTAPGGPPGAPAPDLPEPVDRAKIRGVWQAVGLSLEGYFGPPMAHSDRDVQLLTDASVPLVEAFGMAWLGNWILVLSFVGTVVGVEGPKLRALREQAAARSTRYREFSDAEPADGLGTPTEDHMGRTSRGGPEPTPGS